MGKAFVAKLAKGGARDPEALAAWIGRNKHGKEGFQKLGKAKGGDRADVLRDHAKKLTEKIQESNSRISTLNPKYDHAQAAKLHSEAQKAYEAAANAEADEGLANTLRTAARTHGYAVSHHEGLDSGETPEKSQFSGQTTRFDSKVSASMIPGTVQDIVSNGEKHKTAEAERKKRRSEEGAAFDKAVKASQEKAKGMTLTELRAARKKAARKPDFRSRKAVEILDSEIAARPVRRKR